MNSFSLPSLHLFLPTVSRLDHVMYNLREKINEWRIFQLTCRGFQFLKIKKYIKNIIFILLFGARCYLEKHFCKNWWACSFFAIWPIMLFFLNDGYTSNFKIKQSFGKYYPIFLKIPWKGFIGATCMISNV
jgi:hypothetical protein